MHAIIQIRFGKIYDSQRKIFFVDLPQNWNEIWLWNVTPCNLYHVVILDVEYNQCTLYKWQQNGLFLRAEYYDYRKIITVNK